MLYTLGTSTSDTCWTPAAPRHTQNHMQQTLHAGQRPLSGAHHTHGMWHTCWTGRAIVQDTHEYTAHVISITYRAHGTLWGTLLSQCIHHMCWLGFPSHTQYKEHTHAHAHTAKRLTTSSAAQLGALGPARPVLSCGHKDRWILAGSQTLSLNGRALPCCHLLRAWARILSSFAQPAVPSWCPLFPPCHLFPPQRSYPAPFPQRPQRTKLEPRAHSAGPPTGPTAAASPSRYSRDLGWAFRRPF